MKYRMLAMLLAACTLLVSIAQARPQQRPELRHFPTHVDVVGDVDGTATVIRKAAQDTLWIATWNFEGCDDAGWVRSDNHILNDGNVYWSVNATYNGVGNIVGDAASVGDHNLCWDYPDNFGTNWYQGIRLHYMGNSFLSFDFAVDSDGGFEFLQVETDSACSSFGQVDYDVNPLGNARVFRDLLWSISGFDTVTARVDSIPLSGYTTGDTHCVYIAFTSDSWMRDWWPIPFFGPGAIVDNVLLDGSLSLNEDFTGFIEMPGRSFVNMHDSTPFGAWARTYQHITDNDLCTENLSCAWLATDHTTPTLANDPSMAFGPGGYIIKNWLDEVVVGPWVSLSSTAGAISTIVQFDRFGGNNFSTGRIAQNWSIRSRSKVSNTDTPAPGDSIDCLSSWGHGSSWNSLGTFSWRQLDWDATADFDQNATDIQLRFRVSDWQYMTGAPPPTPFNPGPGPFWDNVRVGRQLLTGPVIDEGIDARYQGQDAAPNDSAHESGGLYEQATGPNDIFGTVAFSRAWYLGPEAHANLIIGDSITVNVIDVLGAGGLNVEVHAAIVAGPHVGKSPAPYTVGASGFFVIPAEPSHNSSGNLVEDNYYVDLDDTYFRGGDIVHYFWWATDQQGGATSNPAGLNALPGSVVAAEAATGGLFEVSFLPTIKWDVNYLSRIAADPNGDLDPTPGELGNSSQANCILYYENHNSRRRSGDLNRTSFMYTLDKLGYAGKYDIYDHQGFGNTNNHLGARMSPEQARYYSLLIYDAGNRNPGAPILPDGTDLSSGRIDMSTWFQTWNALSGTPNPEHTLWLIASNVMQENPSDPLFATMGVSFQAADQGQDLNPNVFGIANFTNHVACLGTHSDELFALKGGCPTIRNYDDVRATGTGVQTHVYGKNAPSSAGAIVMHANVGGYTTILQSFPWFDMRTSIGQPPTLPDEVLLDRVLKCAVPSGCWGGPSTDIDDGEIERIATPARTALHQNSPNPFNPVTTISFDLAHDSHVSLHIYDVAGRQVRALTNEKMTVGFNKKVQWNGLDDAGRRVSSGVYFYRLQAQDFRATRKLVVMK